MQGQRSVIGSLSESLGFDHGSTSSDAGVDQQMSWNSNWGPAPNRLSDFMSPNNTTEMLLNSTSQGLNLGTWSMGESSSSALHSQGTHVEREIEHRHEPTTLLSLDGPINLSDYQNSRSPINLSDYQNSRSPINLSEYQNSRSPLFLQRSRSSSPSQELNGSSSFVNRGVTELGSENAFRSSTTENLRLATAAHSDHPGASLVDGGYLVEETEARRRSCKRKAFELSIGQSSGSGSSNFFQRPDSRNASSGLTISTPSEYNGPSEQVVSNLGLGVGGVSSESLHALGAAGSAESSHRNQRSRINASQHQDPGLTSNVLTPASSVGESNLPPVISDFRLAPLNNLSLDNSSPQGQSALRVPGLRRNMQPSRWNRQSGSRSIRSAGIVMSGDRDPEPREGSTSVNLPINLSEHPMFVPATEMQNSVQNGVNWSLAGVNSSNGGHIVSTSQVGPSSGVHSPSWVSRRSSSQYSRRMSEILRRSLLSSSADLEAGVQSNIALTPPPGAASSSQQGASSSGVVIRGHHISQPRSAVLLDRQDDGPFGIPHSLRALAAATQGRSIASEIRNVLDLMRRGEGLRFEDVVVLDQSVFFGLADANDRHRDMRLDIDNMSYEELLALEERIGDVSTGLSEETVLNRLKQRKFFSIALGQLEIEPCSICQDEYKDGDDVGALECGHDFHTDCIKQWLVQKNICPICKSTALST